MEGYLPAAAEPSVLARFSGSPEAPHISILCLGSKDEFSRRAQPSDMERFPDSWAWFQGTPKKIEGTPLSELPGIDERRASAFTFHGIQTVEQLAGLHDGALGAMGVGAMELRRIAKMYVENKFIGQRGEDAARVRALEQEVSTLKQQFSEIVEINRKLLEKSGSKETGGQAAINLCAKLDCNSRVKVSGGFCRWHAMDESPKLASPAKSEAVESDSEDEQPEPLKTPEGYTPAPEKAFEYQK